MTLSSVPGLEPPGLDEERSGLLAADGCCWTSVRADGRSMTHGDVALTARCRWRRGTVPRRPWLPPTHVAVAGSGTTLHVRRPAASGSAVVDAAWSCQAEARVVTDMPTLVAGHVEVLGRKCPWIGRADQAPAGEGTDEMSPGRQESSGDANGLPVARTPRGWMLA